MHVTRTAPDPTYTIYRFRVCYALVLYFSCELFILNTVHFINTFHFATVKLFLILDG